MSDFLFEYYNWIKALHVIAVMSWMAGLLYLPRLFVYHADAKAGSDVSEQFKIMERKLLRFIMNPAMIASWIFGILMIVANTTLFSFGWFHAKLTLVVLMSVLHMVFARWRKTFERDENTRGDKFYRWWNEAPTVLMIIIVIMAIAEPF
ncbi:MAG: protoporphyrinogen oxidase HemJ [Alphaproteobacteria bacterium]|nr:protoporphyrinogen oxidase HemJ [Alphaproteobacteria bacterium]MDP7221701.1 protoporphyrinogen oxidase HemJ [Alphaproteobacteria bacterium]